MKYLLAMIILMIGLVVPVSADLVHSWEDSLDGWLPVEGSGTLTPQTTGDGVPAAAITDGTHALTVTHGNPAPGEVAIMRINNSATDWFTALKDANSTAMLIDVHVPAASVDGWWAAATLRLEGGGFSTTQIQNDLSANADNTVTIELDLTSIAGLQAAPWAQATIAMNGGGDGPNNTGPPSLSPVYVDNFRIVSIPEPASIAILGIVGLLCGVVRWRMG